MQQPLIGDITVRVAERIKKGTKTVWEYKPIDQLNECFREIELTGNLPTHIRLNSKTLAEIEKNDPEGCAIGASSEAKSKKAIWYANVEIDDSIPDNKFIIFVRYDLKKCKDCNTCEQQDQCDFPNKIVNEPVDKPEERDEP